MKQNNITIFYFFQNPSRQALHSSVAEIVAPARECHDEQPLFRKNPCELGIGDPAGGLNADGRTPNRPIAFWVDSISRKVFLNCEA